MMSPDEPHNPTPPESPQDDLPQELTGDLQALFAPTVEVPQSLDRAILADGRRELAGRATDPERLPAASLTPAERRRWMLLRRLGPALAAAAAIALVVVALNPWERATMQARMSESEAPAAIGGDEPHLADASSGGSESPAEPIAPAPTLAEREDIDHSGRVDILDAFALARMIENQDTRIAGQRRDARGDVGRAADARPNRAGITEIPAMFDLNGDGAVDQGDVDAVAMAAVSLKGGA